MQKNENKKLIERIRQSRLDISKLDSRLTGEFIRFENRIREELLYKLTEKMKELEYSLQEFNQT